VTGAVPLPCATCKSEPGVEQKTTRPRALLQAQTRRPSARPPSPPTNQVDDLIATGGTLAAGASLVRRLGAVAAGAACVVELPGLGGRAAIGGLPLFTLIGGDGGGG
jgi:hypothetical protein